MHSVLVNPQRGYGINLPTVCRYLESRFVEAFVEKGALRLGTFGHYETIEDDVRKDQRDGRMNFQFHREGLNVAGVTTVGRRSYVMCASLLESEQLQKRFRCDNFVRIRNPLLFADAISRYIPGFMGGHIGPCIYRKERSVSRETGLDFGIKEAMAGMAAAGDDQAALSESAEKSRRLLSQDLHREIQFENIFIKEENPFACELEYRIVWDVAHDAPQSTLDIECPEAIQFCEVGVETENTRNKKFEFKEDSGGTILGIAHNAPGARPAQ